MLKLKPRRATVQQQKANNNITLLVTVDKFDGSITSALRLLNKPVLGAGQTLVK
jgi:hypothetical protein